MILFKWFMRALFFSLGVSFASAAYADCNPTPTQREILRSFIFVPTNSDFCAPESLERKALDSLLFVKNLHWTASAKDDLVQDLIGPEPFLFFRDRIDKIVIEQSGTGSLCDNGRTMAYNLVGTREMHICSLAKTVSVFYLAEILIHEARHSDGDGYFHYDCRTGARLKVGGACDESFEQGGAFAVSAEFSVRVSRDPSLSAEVRAEARSEAYTHFLTRFYVKPLGMQKGVFLQEAEGRIQFFDGANLSSTRLYVNPREKILSVRNRRLLVFGQKNPFAADLSYSGQMFLAADLLSKFYRETLTAEERLRVVDVYYGATYSCVLLTDRLRCINEIADEVKNLPLGSIRARGFLDVTQSSSPRDAAVHIIDDTGSSYRLPQEVSGLRELNEDRLKALAKPTPLVNLAYVGANQVALDHDGYVGLYSPSEKRWTTPLQNRKFVKLLGTVYWSQKFDAL